MALQVRQNKKIGSYQLGDLLGRGSIGTVYKGLNLELGTIVAIKQVSLTSLKGEHHKALEQEINLLKKLKHENIVKYVDCIETEGFLNIILEYIESGSLASIIKKFGSFPESLVAIYTKQVLKGLEYLHRQGIVHRDIKGANILTTKDGVVKLADFGVATSLDDVKSYSLVGTPYWMAPEVIEMQGHVSTSCDIWSLGCTVIELLTGNPPYFDLMQYPALFRIVQDDCPPLPEGISTECTDFLRQTFQKDPSLRIDAKNLLLHPWVNKGWHIVQGPHLPEEITNTIRMHIVDQSNFGTFISDSFIEQIPPLMHCSSPRKIDKSSAVRDSQLDSLRQLKLRSSNQVKANGNGFWGYNEEGQAMREINELLQQMSQESEVIRCLTSLKEVAYNERGKEFLVTHGLVVLLEQLDIHIPRFCQGNAISQGIIKQIAELINSVVDQPQLLELACSMGAIQFFQQLTSSEFPKELRLEAAYFLGQLTYHKEGYLLAVGGLDNLMDLLSEDTELIGLALDTILLLYESQQVNSRNLSRMFTSKFISFRLALLIEQLQHNEVAYMIKALDLLVMLSKCEDKYVKNQLCEKEVITKLMTFLNCQNEAALCRIVKIFRYLSNEPTLQSSFDGFALIPKTLYLLKRELPNGQMIPDILRIIFYLTKLNLEKQEELAVFDGIPILLELCSQASELDNQLLMKKVAISILCSLSTASSQCRTKIQEHGGVLIYINFLKSNLNVSKLLDTIGKYLEDSADDKIKQLLAKNIDTLTQSFRPNTIPLFPTLVKLLPKEFIQQNQFCKTLADLLQSKEQSQLNTKHLLQMLLTLLENIKYPRDFLKTYNLLSFCDILDQEYGLAVQSVAKSIKELIIS